MTSREASSRAAWAQEWIRNPLTTVEVEGFGGLCDWIDISAPSHRGAFYPEITGYALSVVEWLVEATGASGWDELSTEICDLLTRLVGQRSGGVSGSHRNGRSKVIYTFDTGMVCKGLAARLARVPDPTVEEAVDRAGAFIRSRVGLNGCIRPTSSNTSGTEQRWSEREGPYLTKSLLGLLRRGPKRVSPPALRRALDRAGSRQDAAGFFPVLNGRLVHLHAHLYACEALMLLGHAWKDSVAVSRAVMGVDAALAVFRRHGRLPAGIIAGSPVRAERSDTLAQLLRLAVMTDRGSEKDKAGLAVRLATYQLDDGPYRGALRFGSDMMADGGVRRLGTHLNTWSTLFAIQAWLVFAERELARDWWHQPWLFA